MILVLVVKVTAIKENQLIIIPCYFMSFSNEHLYLLPFVNNPLPHVRCNEGVSSQHCTSLGVGQVGSGLSVDGQDEVTNTKASVAADRPSVDDAADQHPQAVFHGAHRHAFKVDHKYLLDLRHGF